MLVVCFQTLFDIMVEDVMEDMSWFAEELLLGVVEV